MLIFVLVFLTVYGGLNGYVYFTLVSGLGHGSWPIALGLGFLVLSPILLRLSEGRVPRFVSKTIAWVGYNWMGVSFLFSCIALVFDFVQLFSPNLFQRGALAAVIILTLVFSLLGFIESRRIRVRYFKVQTPKLGYTRERPFRILQMSDLHLGYGTLPGQVTGLIKTIKSLAPDLIVSTGDLFDTDLEHLGVYVDQLKSLNPPKGKLAITGNHEVYAGLYPSIRLTEESGFKVLRSASIEIDPHLYIAGVDDPEALQGKPSADAEQEALRAIPEIAFTVLLKHRPHVSAELTNRFDLQLSGHTHGGQIFPFIFMTRLQYKTRHGLSRIARSTFLYLSRGTGTWGPQIRLFAPPEITVFYLMAGAEFTITPESR